MNSVFSPFRGEWFHAIHSHYSLLTHTRRLEFLSQISSTHENPPLQQLPKPAPSFPDSRRWCIYLINCLYLLRQLTFPSHIPRKTHKPTSPTINRPLGAPSSFLLNFRPLAFPSRLPSSHLSVHPTRFTRKKIITHPIEP